VTDVNVHVVQTFRISNSKDYNNHKKLDEAVKNYLRYTIPDGTSVGLVNFSSVATTITSRMVYINDTNGRENLVKLLSPNARGGTSIGAGVTSALQVKRPV